VTHNAWDDAAFQLLFEKNPLPMWVYDAETLAFLAVNEAAVAVYGYTHDEFLGMTLDRIRPPDDVAPLRSYIKAMPRGRVAAGEWRHLTKGGTLLCVEVHSVSLDWKGCAARLSTAFDVTDRNRATEDLNRFFELTSEILCIAGRDGKILRMNPRGAAVLGYSVEEMEGQTFAAFAVEEDVAPALRLANSLAEGSEARDVAIRYRHRNGSERVIEWQVRAAASRLYAVGRDITERRARDQRMEVLLRAVEQSPGTVVITDRQGRIEYVNPKFEQLTGYSLSEAIGQNPRLLKSGQTPGRVYEELWGTIAAGGTWEGELVNRKKDGSLYLERATISPVRDETGAICHYVAVKEDISERRALEQQLQQAQKMEAIGLLAGGVAHDFNNLLTVINGYADLLRTDGDLSAKARAQVVAIHEAGLRAAALTKELLLLGSRKQGELQVIDLGRAVRDLRDLCRSLLPENIELTVTTAPGLVRADPAQISQLVMNLVLNARDAMPDGGDLRISVEPIRISEVAQRRSGIPSGDYFQLSVTDTGHGMTDTVKNRLFEPFFTTKAEGRGTGLGLSIVYGIVKQSGAQIQVESQPGCGSTISIYFPRAVSEPEVEHAPAGPEQISLGGETILLVEDFSELRKMTGGFLKELGYRVIEAADGRQALHAAREHRHELDLLLSDVMLPGMNGPEVAAQLKLELPDLPVLFMTGYAGEQHGLTPASNMLNKPFSRESLAAKVRQLLRQVYAQRRVLVVDDDAGVVEFITRVLGDTGYSVSSAPNGAAALAMVEQLNPDVMVLDIVMPEKEGLETIREFRTRKLEIPIIAISGMFYGQFLRAARILGAAATLQKPLLREELLSTVRFVLRSKAMSGNRG